MPTYAMLGNYTQQGISVVKDQGPDRVEGIKQAFKDAGGELKDFYLLMGQYDFLIMADLPDDETVARMAMNIGAMGTVRTTTMRAFDEGEYRSIVASLS
jgi:uncharacterized protein with GYD domain